MCKSVFFTFSPAPHDCWFTSFILTQYILSPDTQTATRPLPVPLVQFYTIVPQDHFQAYQIHHTEKWMHYFSLASIPPKPAPATVFLISVAPWSIQLPKLERE
jgi:hypothetical protein